MMPQSRSGSAEQDECKIVPIWTEIYDSFSVILSRLFPKFRLVIVLFIHSHSHQSCTHALALWLLFLFSSVDSPILIYSSSIQKSANSLPFGGAGDFKNSLRVLYVASFWLRLVPCRLFLMMKRSYLRRWCDTPSFSEENHINKH